MNFAAGNGLRANHVQEGATNPEGWEFRLSMGPGRGKYGLQRGEKFGIIEVQEGENFFYHSVLKIKVLSQGQIQLDLGLKSNSCFLIRQGKVKNGKNGQGKAGDQKPVMWIRIHLGPWIRIQRYKITDKMKGKAEFNQQKYFFFAGNYMFQF